MAKKRVKFTTSTGERVSFAADPKKSGKGRKKKARGVKRKRVTFKAGGKSISFMARVD